MKAALITATAYATNFGSIEVDIDGTNKTIYVVGASWNSEYVTVQDNGFILKGGG